MRRLAIAVALAACLFGQSVQAATWHLTKMTWYGPGFYGNRTACGQRMTHWLVGVAMRPWVSCGTHVEVMYHHKTMRLKVVDHCGCAVGSAMDLTARADIDLVGGKPYTIPRAYWRFSR